MRELKALCVREGENRLEDIRRELGETLHREMGILRSRESIARAAETVSRLKAELEQSAAGSVKAAAD